MKIVCSQKKFLEALHIVSRAINPNNILPVLSNILIRAEGKILYFAGTNLDIAIRCHFTADVKNEGAITIPAKLLLNYVSLLPEESLEISVSDGLVFSLLSGSSQTKIKGIHPDEFPVIPEIEKGESFKLPAKEFSDAVNQVAFAASQGSSRPVLSGVLFSLEKGELKLVATDSYRLAEKTIKVGESVDVEVKCIVPARTIIELGKLIDKSSGGELEVSLSENQILFRINNIELTSRLIEGKFPDYDRIIPKEYKTRAEVVNESLLQAVKRVSLFARENNNRIKVSVTNDGKLNLSTDETRVGEERAEVDVEVEGDNNKTNLNGQYLLDVLPTLGGEKFFIEMGDRLSPVAVRSKKDEEYVYIIMPLKV